jgi:hypothetical protein
MREIIFHNSLVTYKDFLNFIFSFEGLKPYVFGEMINKNNIIFETICWHNKRGPYIEKIIWGGCVELRDEIEKDSLW